MVLDRTVTYLGIVSAWYNPIIRNALPLQLGDLKSSLIRDLLRHLLSSCLQGQYHYWVISHFSTPSFQRTKVPQLQSLPLPVVLVQEMESWPKRHTVAAWREVHFSFKTRKDTARERPKIFLGRGGDKTVWSFFFFFLLSCLNCRSCSAFEFTGPGYDNQTWAHHCVCLTWY